jgi:oxygen-dependent protoporphyrinogen oxidase
VTSHVPVAIVGGGIAGLAAAYELHLRRVPFVLFERAPRAGGVILTEEIDGFTIDAGPDALLVQKPAAVALCQELGLGPRLFPTKTPRTAFIVRNRRLHPLPEASVLGIPTRLAPLAATPLFSLPGKLRMGLEIVLPRRRLARDEDESIGAFIRRRFGHEAVTYLAEPLLAGIHSGDVDRLSMRALFPRLLQAEQTRGSVMRAFRALKSAPDSDGAFRSLPGGIGELVAALVRALPPESIRTGVGVERLAGPPPWQLRTSTGEPLTAGHVILAVPAHLAAPLLAGFDPGLAERCRAIPYVSTVTVALAYERPAVHHPLLGSGFVVPRAETDWRITAGSWISSKWPDRAPAGHVLLRAFLGGARDPGAIDLEDTELAGIAHRDMAALLGIEGAPLFSRVYRWPRTGAQHEVGHLRRVADIEQALQKWPGLRVTGSAYRGTGIPDCVADGRATARAVAGAGE